MKNTFITLLFLGLIIITNDYANAQYNSDFEENTFNQYFNNNGNVYDLLNALNYNEALYAQGKRQIDAHIAFLKAKNIEQKSIKKRIQTIYKTTHNKFFKKYEAKAFFNHIFENGQYNCVTASALYALLFDEFGINYSIRETPVHIYLIADTTGLQTLIESTLPGTGIINFSEKFKKDYVAYLNKNKLISDEEFENSTTEQLFRENYSQDKSINLWELTAIQYYNKGILLMEEEKYTGAALYLNKAKSIYPSNNISYNHYAALQNGLMENLKKKSYDADLFSQVVLSSLEDSSLTQLMYDYFDNISHELCVNNPDIKRYDQFFNEIQLSCSTTPLPNNLLHKYHYYRAYNFMMMGSYPPALAEVKKSYHFNRDNLFVKELAQQIAVKHLFIERSYRKQIDSLEYYFNELPFLSENQLFQQQYVYYYVKVISDCFMYDEPLRGIEYYNRFITALDRFNINNYSDEHISVGFGITAFYYAENANFSKALRVVNKGLELSPESLRLKQAKSDIEDAKRIYTTGYKNYTPYTFTNIETPETLKEKVHKHFPGKWRAVSIIMEDMEQDLNKNETFEFIADKDKNCTYIHNGKTEKGKWAYRPKSKCIYFVPHKEKDDYKVFKVKEASANKIVLLPFKDQKTPSPYKYILKPI